MVAKIRAQLDQAAACAQPAVHKELGHPCPRCAMGTMNAMVIVTRLFAIIKPGYRLLRSTELQHNST
jgi:hypothetical protein